MGSFGNAGVRTVRTSVSGVQVKITDGEILSYRLTALGAEPLLNLSCKHRTLWAETDFPGHPIMQYDRDWPRNAADADADDDVYVFSIAFLTATKYTLVVEHQDKNHSVINVIKDIDYESDDPTDKFRETLRVFTS